MTLSTLLFLTFAGCSFSGEVNTDIECTASCEDNQTDCHRTCETECVNADGDLDEACDTDCKFVCDEEYDSCSVGCTSD